MDLRSATKNKYEVGSGLLVKKEIEWHKAWLLEAST